MSLNDRARIRSRWPATFDIEGVPRDPKVRNQRLEANMQISKVKQTGTFDFNNPPTEKYDHQEFPRLMYQGERSMKVIDEGEQERALEMGYFLTKVEALEAADPAPTDNIEEHEEIEAADHVTEEAAAHVPTSHHRAKPPKKKKH